MPDAELQRFRRAFNQAYGAVLVTGPTGSGKSTTLYAALGAAQHAREEHHHDRGPGRVSSCEGVTQVQVNSKAGLTFATGLRSIMRADPDMIMVGEIRDRETAQIAVEAALTGHLVLSTLHTNDAPTAITRLIEMGIEPFLVASAIDCVVAQRLARTLCPHCKRRTILTAEVLRANGFRGPHRPRGLRARRLPPLRRPGYKGRVGLYEVMTVNDEIRRWRSSARSADAIAEVAVRNGMRRLREDGLEKVKLGRTSIAEIARVDRRSARSCCRSRARRFGESRRRLKDRSTAR